MDMGGFKVLLSAEVDAVIEEKNDTFPVEIKSGNPRYFGFKVMLQMIANGAQFLVQAEKRGRTQLVGVKKRSLREVICAEKSSFELLDAQEKILDALEQLREQAQGILEG